MNDFRMIKFFISLVSGSVLAFCVSKLLGIRLSDALMILGALTIAGSFTFLHTMLGLNAARAGSALNQYEKVSRDMRYHIREERGFIKETLTAGAIEALISAVMMLMQ